MGPRPTALSKVRGQNPHRVRDGLGTWSAIAPPLGMLGYHQPRDPHVHGLPSRRRRMSERSMTDNHDQTGTLLTLSSVRSRRHSYHSQADSAGSIPVIRSKREQRCSTSESDWISQAGQRSFASENGTRAITRAISHLGECPWRLSVPKLTVRV